MEYYYCYNDYFSSSNNLLFISGQLPINYDGSIMCNKCGIIINSIINYSIDSRYYGSDDCKYSRDPSRIGIPINPYAPKSSLGTIILGHGNQSFRTLHKWYSTNYKERSLLKD